MGFKLQEAEKLWAERVIAIFLESHLRKSKLFSKGELEVLSAMLTALTMEAEG